MKDTVIVAACGEVGLLRSTRGSREERKGPMREKPLEPIPRDGARSQRIG
jgi:hypothetical protein